MTLNLSENNCIKATLIATSVFLVVGVWLYIGGGIFMLAFNHNFDDATPLTLYQYWYHYGSDRQVTKWIYIASGVSLVLLVSPIVYFFSPVKKSLFGAARFAKRSEIKKAGLLGEKGLIVGKLGNRYLMFDGQQHAIISAPTRSGKGVGIVIPNLLNWPGSVVVLDVKQENFDITSGYRKKYGQECYLFNPAASDYRTHRYNPLSYINKNPNFRIDDIQKIANMLFPDQPGTDVIWTATPRSFFLGIVLFLIETPGKLITLGQVLRETLADGDGAAYFGQIINDRAAGGNPLSGACIRALKSYVTIASENTRAGVMTSFRSRLELWMNPLVDAATSANDFDLRDVRKRRMSIYLGVTPDNLDRMAPLLNLFFQQLLDLNTRELPNQNKEIKYECLLLMDEFTSIGKIGILSKGISYIASYRLRMMPIIQSPAQLVSVYGKDAAQTFTTNHALNIIYPPKASETQTARDISEWLGYQTVKSKSESKNKYLFSSRKNASENLSDQRRALLLPQEITSLGRNKEMVIMENVPPILAWKILYYKDPTFINRLQKISPRLNSIGKRIPTREQLDSAILSGELKAHVPMIDLKGYQRLISSNDRSITVEVPQKNSITVERPVTPADAPKLAKLGLASFKVDFSAVEKPKTGEMDETALFAYADILSELAGVKM